MTRSDASSCTVGQRWRRQAVAVGRHWLQLTALSGALSTACNVTPQDPQRVAVRVREYRLEPPDTAYRLDSSVRAELQPDLDADAVQRLLSHVMPAYRDDLLRLFSQHAAALVVIDDPQLRAILEDVYAARFGGYTEAQLAALAAQQPESPGIRGALERIEAARWAELKPGPDSQPDYGIGVAYFVPGVNGTPPVNDTVVLRAGRAWNAQQLARFVFSMPSATTWFYAVLAPDRNAHANLLEFGYEEAGLPIDSILPDSSWALLLYGQAPSGAVQRGWAPLWEGRLAYVLWSEWLPERARFFLRDNDIRFFRSPGGAPVVFSLARAETAGRSRYDYHLEPDSAAADWLRVRVVTPSNACSVDVPAVRDTIVWVRYLQANGRPTVWYYTRGC